MPREAHEKVFVPLMDSCIDALGAITDDLYGSSSAWYADRDRIEEGEWEDRDGFWSHNNGIVEFCYPANAMSLYYEGHDNPHIKKYVDSLRDDLLEAARGLPDCPADETDGNVLCWLAERHDDVECDVLSTADESTPFVKASFMLKDVDGYQFHGHVDDDTVLDLHFRFGFNDDFGYGRHWCQGGYYGPEGFGDRDTVNLTLRFTLKDLDWVRDQVARIPELVRKTPDSTAAQETVLESPSIKK